MVERNGMVCNLRNLAAFAVYFEVIIIHP